MDIEFHYYMTYLIAARAGFEPRESLILAYTSQHIDDNDLIYEINPDTPEYYSNYISQTINILKPKKVLLRIYPIFHFIPGDPFNENARRKDGKMHYLNTTPDSKNAQAVLHSALNSGDIYRIGLACHSYADSWSHENFVGFFDQYNAPNGEFKSLGHVAAIDRPDRTAAVWNDSRLIDPLARKDNKTIYLQAAGRIFDHLRAYLYPALVAEIYQADKKELIEDLSWAIGVTDRPRHHRNIRIERYKELSRKNQYGGVEIKNYDINEWMDDAVKENVRGFRIRSKKVAIRFIKSNLSEAMPRFKDHYTWKDPANYRQTHWYRFQEAVKAQQEITTEILIEPAFQKMDLDMANW